MIFSWPVFQHMKRLEFPVDIAIDVGIGTGNCSWLVAWLGQDVRWPSTFAIEKFISVLLSASCPNSGRHSFPEMGTQGNQILTIFLLPRCGIPDRMFYNFGVALYCLLGACPVFVAGTGCEISSPYIDKPGILTPIFRSVMCNNYFRFCSVPFLSVLGFPESPLETYFQMVYIWWVRR